MDKSEKTETRKCVLCKMKLEHIDDYHPYGFCVLYRVGIDPIEFIPIACSRLGYIVELSNDERNIK